MTRVILTRDADGRRHAELVDGSPDAPRVPTPPDFAPPFGVRGDGTVSTRPPARIHAVPQSDRDDATPMRQPHGHDEWRDVTPDLAVKLDRARRGELTGTESLATLADQWVAEQNETIEPVIAGPENIAFHQLVRADITEVADADVPVSRHETIRTSSDWRGATVHDWQTTYIATVSLPGSITAVASDRPDVSERVLWALDNRPTSWQGRQVIADLIHRCDTFDAADDWLDDTRPTPKPNLTPWPTRHGLPAMRTRSAEQNQPTITVKVYRTRKAYRMVEQRAVVVAACTCDQSTMAPHRHIHAVTPDHDVDHERVTTIGRRARPTTSRSTRIARPPRIDVRSLTSTDQLADAMRETIEHHRKARIIRNGRPITIARRNADSIIIQGQTMRDRTAAKALVATT